MTFSFNGTFSSDGVVGAIAAKQGSSPRSRSTLVNPSDPYRPGRSAATLSDINNIGVGGSRCLEPYLLVPILTNPADCSTFQGQVVLHNLLFTLITKAKLMPYIDGYVWVRRALMHHDHFDNRATVLTLYRMISNFLWLLELGDVLAIRTEMVTHRVHSPCPQYITINQENNQILDIRQISVSPKSDNVTPRK